MFAKKKKRNNLQLFQKCHYCDNIFNSYQILVHNAAKKILHNINCLRWQKKMYHLCQSYRRRSGIIESMAKLGQHLLPTATIVVYKCHIRVHACTH